MTPVRWFADHPGEPPIGGLVEYPDEPTARTHAGTAATVWALVPAEAVRVIESAQAWRDPAARRRLATTTADYGLEQLVRAILGGAPWAR